MSIKTPNLTVLSIDGLSYGLLQKLMADGDMPTMSRFCETNGIPRKMRSTFPPVSCVAWTSYATGLNPGKHGIFGFVDRRPGTYETVFPNGDFVRGQTIWEILSNNGKKVFGMNVPCTFPPRKVNGIMIGGFLASSLDRLSYPPAIGKYLKKQGYRIDINPFTGHSSKEELVSELELVLEKQIEALLYFLEYEHWDFFHAHIMCTDRINHFLLQHYYDGNSKLAFMFREFYRKLDNLLEQLLDALGKEASLLILSDHGFAPIKQEVQLGRFFADAGLLAPQGGQDPFAFDALHTKAFCLTPGRIYINLKGREAQGCVLKSEYKHVRESVSKVLLELCDDDGNQIIKTIQTKEEVYWPDGSSQPDTANIFNESFPFSMAPDLVAIPFDGYDLKNGINASSLFAKSALEGMHTYENAICMSRNLTLPTNDLEIGQMAGVILRKMNVNIPPEMDISQIGRASCRERV